MTKFFVDASGRYLGGFDEVEPPEGSLEVPSAPEDARQLWTNSEWVLSVEAFRDAMVHLSPRQIRLGLSHVGIAEADVDASLANDPLGMIEWKHATTFKRVHPLIDALGVGFSLAPEQIDSLWEWASAL